MRAIIAVDASIFGEYCRNTIALVPVKDFLVLGMWLVSAVKRTVRWRGNLMWVGPGSRLEPVMCRPTKQRSPDLQGEIAL